MSLVSAEVEPVATPDTGTDVTPPAAEGTAAAEPVAVVESSDWYYDAEIKGNGTKPEWLKDSKYKTVTDQAKAYTEIEKKLGAFTGAPESYDLKLPNNPEIEFKADDPLLQDFLAKSKANGANQEFVSGMLETYAEAMTAMIPDPAAEMAKLGAKAQEEVNILGQWAQSKFTADEFEVFRRMTTTAESVRLFEKIRQLSTQADVAPPSSPHVSRETEDQVRALVSDPRYATDPAFRAEVKRKMSAALGVK